jgi:Protein of unknown function (DUF1579)
MKKRIVRTATVSLTGLFAAAAMSFAQETAKDPAAAAVAQSAPEAKVSGQPSEADMMAKMMEMSKLNDNHKLLATMAGTWNYTVKMWMDPKGNPTESKGIATRKVSMDGRYLHGDYSGKFKMPGADGKMKDVEFHGMSLDGYDNAKQKFVSAWVDNMGTGIMLSEGTYDPSTKAFTFTGEYEAMPGMKSKIREVITMADKDHHSMEYYEDRGQGEMKSMEINYIRGKK